MKNIKLHIFLLLGFITTSLVINAQIRVIDNKGTVSTIDASKWTRIGTTNDIYDKFPGNVGIGTTTPMATLHNAGSTLLGVTNVSLTDPTYLPTAQVTVDAYSGIVITQQSTDLALTLPTPTSATAGRLFTVSNSITSTNYVKVSSCTLPAGMSVTLVWDGTQWSAPLASPITVVNNSNLFSTGLASTGSGVTSTSNSNFLGLGAGYNATGASNSNFLGSGSGGIAMGASYSNFFGQNAGYNAITANNSNFLGQNAGQAATNASGANFLGSNTGYAASGATYSNFIGNNAGQWATNASYSTLLGYNVANENSLGTHIGSNNIIIGTNITLPATTANGINIGGVLFGLNTYSTTSGNPSSVATGSGKIGIGIVSPTAHLHLAASSGASGTAPLKLSAGTNLSTTEAGTIEYNGTHLYFTAINGGPRYQIDGQGLSLPLSSLTATVVTNNITNGDYDQTWNWNSSTTKNPFTIASNSLTTGNLFSLVNSNTSHTGNLLVLTSNATAPVGGITKFNFTGNHTGNGLEIDDVTASGAAVAINANALTTGTALNISSVSTSITGGQLLNVATSGVNVASGSTTTAATISNTHGGDTPTNVGLTVSAGGGLKNYALLVPSGYVGIGTNTPAAALDVKGQINITQASGTGSVGLVAPATLTGYTLTLPSAQSSNGQILQNDGLGNLSWVSGLTNSLTAGNINVGNSSGVATPVSISGDATLATDGTLTLKPIISSGSYGSTTSIPTFTVDTKGRVTAASNVTPSGTWGINITGNASGTSANVTGIVAAANGGTGVTTVAAEQTRLGLGTMAYAATGSYALTNGTNATGTWPIGITGNATTATTATNWSGSGALGSYLPLAGGTLTGALTGTSIQANATFRTPNVSFGETSRLALNSGGSTIETAYGWSGSGTGSKTFLQLWGFAPPTMTKTTGDMPAPYGIGFGNGSESGGIMPIGAGDNLQEIMSYGANSGPTTFTWKYQVWDGTNNGYSAAAMSLNANSGQLYVAGNVGASSFTGAGTGLTGTASGLNIGGNAATATTATNWSGSGALGSYLPLAGGTMTGQLNSQGNQGSGIGTGTGGLGAIMVQGNGTNAAFMAFHRPGSYAAYFGLDTDNQWKVGGWSAGAVAYVLLHSGNYNSYSPTLTGGNASGTWGINITGTANNSNHLQTTAGTSTWNWSGQGGQPTWLWGSNDGINMYVYNPSNFNVNSATTATNSTNATYGRYAYNNGAYSGSGWVEPSDLGVRYANSAGSAGSAGSLTGQASVNGSDVWFRSSGGCGWYSTTYAVGIYATEAGNVRTYNGANFISGGSITATGDVTAFSDIRLKKNIRTLSPVSASLREINAVEFDRKDIKAHQIGFIAQNVQKYFPDLISIAKDSMATLSLNYQAMTAPLLKGWQEHDTIIIKQQGEIEGLKDEIGLLKESIEELKKAIINKK